jgi:hypothetical protein
LKKAGHHAVKCVNILKYEYAIEELLGRNDSGSGLENREYGHGDPLC